MLIMWRHNPRVKSPVNKSNKQNACIMKIMWKTKRPRKNFLLNGQQNRPWLSHTGSSMKWCSFWIVLSELQKLTVGCTSAKLNSVTRHEHSELHKYASATCKDKSAPKESSCVANAINRLKKSSFDKLAIMFRRCHVLVLIWSQPSDFNWMCDLDEVKGLLIEKQTKEPITMLLQIHSHIRGIWIFV